MANSINGITFAQLGIKKIEYKNLLNMPSRIGEVFYDWGNELQPLVTEADIVWNSNKIIIDCIHDAEHTTQTLEDLLNQLFQIKECTLVTDYGTFDTILTAVTNTKTIAGITFFSIELAQQVNTFPALPAALGAGSGMKIGDYYLYQDFGIIVKETRDINNIPEYRESSETVYRTPVKKSDYRGWGNVKVSCALPIEHIENIHAFKKLLSTEGLKKLYYRGFTYDCFFSQGFAVNFKRSIVEFDFYLHVGRRDATLHIEGNNVVILNNDETPSEADGTYFGSFDIRGATMQRTFVIHNDGADTLNISSVIVDGVGFSLVSATSGNIPPAGTMSFSVRFDPTEYPRTYGAYVRVYNSDPLYNPYTFKVGGISEDSALIGVLQVFSQDQINPIFIADGDTSPSTADGTDFGDVNLFGLDDRIYVLKNVGLLDLTIVSANLSSSNYFSITSPPSNVVIKAGSSRNITVRFSPAGIPTVQTNTLNIIWNDGKNAGNNTYNFNLRAEAALLDIGIIVRYAGVSIPNDSAPLIGYGNQFGDVDVGATLSHDFVAECTDVAAILANSGLTEHFLLSKVPIPIMPFQSVAFSVIFSPKSTGVKTGFYELMTLTHTYRLNFSGNGIAPAPVGKMQLRGKNNVIIALFGNITSTVDGTDFGYTTEGNYLLQQFTIANIGTAVIDMDNYDLILTDNVHWLIHSAPSGGGLLPGDVRTFIVRFTASPSCQISSGCLTRLIFSAPIIGGGTAAFNIYLRGRTDIT